MLISEVIDRTYNEFLYTAGANMPTFDLLQNIMGVGDSSFTVQGLRPFIPQGIVEIGNELILTRESETTPTIDVVERGFRETDAAEHASGVKVYIDPEFPRISVYNAIKSVIGQLYSMGLYVKAVQTTSFNRDVITLPSTARRVLAVLVKRTTGSTSRWKRLRLGWDVEEFQELSPIEVQLRNGPFGADTRIVYSKDFTLPSSIDADENLTTLGVPETLQPYLPMAAAGYLIQGKEIPRIQIDEIRRALEAANVPVGSPSGVGRALIDGFKGYVAAERFKQAEQQGTNAEFVLNR